MQPPESACHSECNKECILSKNMNGLELPCTPICVCACVSAMHFRKFIVSVTKMASAIKKVLSASKSERVLTKHAHTQRKHYAVMDEIT